MSRVGTTYLNLGTYEQNEHPGAGSQSVDNDNLNGNWKKIDTAIGAAHNADGSHKAAVIHSDDLNSDVADGSTLEQDSSTKKLKIKADGITGAQIGDDIIGKEHIKSDVAGTGLDQDSDGSLKVHVDAATIDIETDALVVQKDALPFDIQIFSSACYAGTATANTPTDLTWKQSDNVYTQKIKCYFSHKTHMAYVKLKAAVKTSNASYNWYVKLLLYEGISLVGSSTDNGANTTYGDNGVPECEISVAVPVPGSVGATLTAIVELMANKSTGVDAEMQNAVLTVTST